MVTPYHAKYFAYELTKRCASDSIEKLAAALSDAQVDLNPHQVEAALFAFRSPFSRGAILADEVGLGKTIEAGLLISQKWAERKRRLLVIVPANLRKQWSQELADKFHLPSAILENRSFNEAIRAGNLNPFQRDEIVLCSYQLPFFGRQHTRRIKRERLGIYTARVVERAPIICETALMMRCGGVLCVGSGCHGIKQQGRKKQQRLQTYHKN